MSSTTNDNNKGNNLMDNRIILNFKNSLPETLLLEPAIILMILFCMYNTFFLSLAFPPQNILYADCNGSKQSQPILKFIFHGRCDCPHCKARQA
jgi:hypothetical protein